MNKTLNKIFVFSLVLFLISCSAKNEKNEDQLSILSEINKESSNSLYLSALNEIKNRNYAEATSILQNIDSKFPLSNEAIQSQLMLAFVDYLQMNYDEAIFKFDQLISKFPSYKNIDYAYYMRAICFYEQIENEALDGTFNVEALSSFNQVINRFPDSKYTVDSFQKIILINENIAAKHMNIGMYYLSRHKYTAAMNRFNKIINTYSKSKFTPEALYRLVEIYSYLDMKEDAKKTAAVIGYNYPKSKWYSESYKLVKPKNKELNKKKSTLKKIKGFFSKNNEN